MWYLPKPFVYVKNGRNDCGDTIWFGTTLGRKPVIKQTQPQNQDGSFWYLFEWGCKPRFLRYFYKVNSAGGSNYYHMAIDGEQGDLMCCARWVMYGVYCNLRKTGVNCITNTGIPCQTYMVVHQIHWLLPVSHQWRELQIVDLQRRVYGHPSDQILAAHPADSRLTL